MTLRGKQLPLEVWNIIIGYVAEIPGDGTGDTRLRGAVRPGSDPLVRTYRVSKQALLNIGLQSRELGSLALPHLYREIHIFQKTDAARVEVVFDRYGSLVRALCIHITMPLRTFWTRLGSRLQNLERIEINTIWVNVVPRYYLKDISRLLNANKLSVKYLQISSQEFAGMPSGIEDDVAALLFRNDADNLHNTETLSLEGHYSTASSMLDIEHERHFFIPTTDYLLWETKFPNLEHLNVQYLGGSQAVMDALILTNADNNERVYTLKDTRMQQAESYESMTSYVDANTVVHISHKPRRTDTDDGNCGKRTRLAHLNLEGGFDVQLERIGKLLDAIPSIVDICVSYSPRWRSDEFVRVTRQHPNVHITVTFHHEYVRHSLKYFWSVNMNEVQVHLAFLECRKNFEMEAHRLTSGASVNKSHRATSALSARRVVTGKAYSDGGSGNSNEDVSVYSNPELGNQLDRLFRCNKPNMSRSNSNELQVTIENVTFKEIL